MIHYLTVIPLILVIIYFQAKVFSQALAKIDVFKAIFPMNKLDYSIGRARIVVSEKRKNKRKRLHTFYTCMKRAILITLSLCILGATSLNAQQIEKIFYGKNGKPTNEVFADFYRVISVPQNEDDEKLFRDFYMNGNIKGEGHYLSANRENVNETIYDGECLFYDKNGNLQKHFIMKDGKLDGTFVVFNEDGSEFIQREYEKGLPKYDWYYRVNKNGAYGRFRNSDDTLVPEEVDTDVQNVIWADGKPWISNGVSGITVSMSVDKVNEYGKYYQCRLLIYNHSFEPIVFDPVDNIFAESGASEIDLLGSAEPIDVLSYLSYQSKVSSAHAWQGVLVGVATVMSAVDQVHSPYSANVNVQGQSFMISARPGNVNVFSPSLAFAGVRETWAEENKAIKQDYLKKNTLNPGQSVSGVVNIKRGSGEKFIKICYRDSKVVIPFYWDVTGDFGVPFIKEDFIANLQPDCYHSNKFNWKSFLDVGIEGVFCENGNTVILLRDGIYSDDEWVIQDGDGKFYGAETGWWCVSKPYRQYFTRITVKGVDLTFPFSLIDKTNSFRTIYDLDLNTQ